MPGGIAKIGAQASDPTGDRYDKDAAKSEQPLHTVRLDPFFMSKFETTQGQWLRIMGENPAFYSPNHPQHGDKLSLRHPVETISWNDAARFAHRTGLLLPTEVQWEYAARAGTVTPWYSGVDEADIAKIGNLSDQRLKRNGGPKNYLYADFDDGSSIHAGVGAYTSNNFLLHDMIGNLYEWCREGANSYTTQARPGDGQRAANIDREKIFRGGNYLAPPMSSRASARAWMAIGTRDSGIGARFSRKLNG